MKRYNPSETPDPNEWLATSEFERIDLVEEFHRFHQGEVPPAQETAHAGIHVVIENQIAMGVEPVGETVANSGDSLLNSPCKT